MAAKPRRRQPDLVDRLSRLTGERSGKGWQAHILAGLGLCALAYVFVTASFADVLVRANPERAHALASHDGKITASYALSEMLMQPDGNPNGRASELAREALRQDPTAVDALTVLGFAAQLRNDPEATMRTFAYSNTLSRRELRPQLFAIEEAVSRGDIVDALRHYDIALRTSSSAPDLLFPKLTQAVSEPAIRAALIPMLKTDPVWGDDFYEHAAWEAADPRSTLALFDEMARAGLNVSSAQQNAVVMTLFRAGYYDDAWRYYAHLSEGVDRRRSRDPDFRSAPEVRTPFDWTLDQQGSAYASILPDADGGVADFAFPPGNGGVVIRQWQLLPPGDYALSGQSNGIDQSDLTRPYWVLSCNASTELGRVPVPNSAATASRFSGRFTVPDGCPVQTLSLVIRSTEDITGVSGQIDRAELRPVQ